MMWVLSINFEAIGGVILMEPYFSHVPNIGDLNLEHTFYRYEEPILFVCVDILGNRYLCSCCQLSECWIICQVREIDLIAMIENKISLNNMFRSTNSKALFLSWNGEMMQYSFVVPEDAYPQRGSFLELSRTKTECYKNFLLSV